MSEAQTRRQQLGTIRRISPDEAWTLAKSSRAILVDTRDPRQYKEMHAQGAIDVPLAEIESSPRVAALASIPADKSIIFYCT